MTVPQLPGYDRCEEVTLRTTLSGGDVEDQSMAVHFVDASTIRVMESSGLFSSFQMLFGDEFRVRKLGAGCYEVVAPVAPSPMCHFEWLGGSLTPENTRALHALGGEWDAELMMVRLHCPRDRVEGLFRTNGGFIPTGMPEIFSGEIDLSIDETTH